MATGEQEGAIPVTSLGPNELNRLREQLQGDVEHLLESHSMLGRAVARSEAAGKAVATLAASKPGTRDDRCCCMPLPPLPLCNCNT